MGSQVIVHTHSMGWDRGPDGSLSLSLYSTSTEQTTTEPADEGLSGNDSHTAWGQG